MLLKSYREYYKRAYGLIAAADAVNPRTLPGLIGAMELRAAAKRAAGTAIRELGSKTAAEPKPPRLRFLSALTCKGSISFDSTAASLCGRIYTLDNDYGLASDYIATLADAAERRGLDSVLCPDPINPRRYEALLIPQADVGFVSVTSGRAYSGECCRHIRLDALVDRDRLRALRPELRGCAKLCERLLSEGEAALARAKTLHDELEDIYNPFVDFDGVYALAETHIRSLLG